MRVGKMHMWISSLACAAALCISGISVSAAEGLYPSFDNRLTKGQTIVIEGEDLVHSVDMEVIEDSLNGGTSDRYKVSGGKALTFTDNPEAYQTDLEQNPSFMINFWAESTTEYQIWMRIRPKNPNDIKKNAVLYHHIDGDRKFDESNNKLTDEEVWSSSSVQMTLGSAEKPAYGWCKFMKPGVNSAWMLKSGNVCINFKFASNSVPFIIDKVIITADSGFSPGFLLEPNLPAEDFYSKEFSQESIPVFPDAKEHPRVLVTKDEIPALKEKLENPYFKPRYDAMKINAQKEINGLLPSNNTEYDNNNSILSVLQDRAFMYLIGEVDSDHADKTIRELKNFMATVTFDTESATYMSRYAGNITTAAACVYDWCYDRLTDTDKEFIRRWVYEHQVGSEVGFPPTRRNFITGHGIEEQINYHQLMAGIAFYDEDPDWYRVVASIVFERMMPARNYFVSSGYGEAFGSYFSSRDTGFAMLNKMIKTLGYEEEIHHETYPDTFNVLLYRSLPNGIWMKDGDDFIWSRYLPDTRSTDSTLLMAYIGSEYDNPYLLRQGMLNYAWGDYNYSVQALLMIDPTKEQKELDELPTTWKTKYPMTMMMARTGWQNGLNSNTAVAFMNGREINIVDHQHRDAGTFQLYYKGMLALDSGLYSSWNGWHHANYTSHTIAHNSMLLYDPDYEEKYAAYFQEQTGKALPSYVTKKFSKEANDGGQRPFDACTSYEDLINNNGKVDSDYAAETLGTYIGPNSTTPAFSYLSTDLTLAYDYRTGGYRRSMVFMDLFNDDYPAAMIVYDHINATDPTYKKTWLLHSEQKPLVDGNTTTITRTDNGQNGKLVNYTLLPAEDNAEISTVGGIGSEFTINGVNYPYDELSENVFAYQHDSGVYRIELSPKTQANDDLFLNAMYVTDADGDLPQLPIIKEETDTYVGASVMDRFVTFSKSFDSITTGFTLTVPENGYQTVSCLLTDMAEGKWSVSDGKTTVFAESKSGEKCIYFTAAPGTYTVTPADADAALTVFDTPKTDKKTYGDFLIRKGSNLMYLPKPNQLIDGTPYVAVDGIMTQFGAVVSEKTDTTVTVTMPKGSVAILTKDSSSYTLNGRKRNLTHPVLWIDGEPYVYLADFKDSSLLNLHTCSYNATSKLLVATPR